MAIRYPLYRPFFDQDEVDAVKATLESGWVAQGPRNKDLEQLVRDKVGVGHAICVNNCTAALHLALLALGVGKGDEVIVADFTYPATGHAVLYCGAKARFADVEMGTYNVDAASIRNLMNKRTKAIMPVHTFGQMADMDAIMELADERQVPVIEDAACALGSTFKGRQAGSVGALGCYSFHARKGVTTGEGGMVVTKDETLGEKVRRLSVFGLLHRPSPTNMDEFNVPEFVDLGYNYKMSDIAAAVGVAQMAKLARIMEIKAALAKVYQKELGEIDDIAPPFLDPRCGHIFQSYVALVSPTINRNRLIKRLFERGIQCQIGTYACHVQPVYASKDRCPNSKALFERTLSLPFYPDLSESDISSICAEIGRTLKECSK
jgi:dTDP-4-amino-4,6-dideoxygalactose transaminase